MTGAGLFSHEEGDESIHPAMRTFVLSISVLNVKVVTEAELHLAVDPLLFGEDQTLLETVRVG